VSSPKFRIQLSYKLGGGQVWGVRVSLKNVMVVGYDVIITHSQNGRINWRVCGLVVVYLLSPFDELLLNNDYSGVPNKDAV
jgi:hypothetical protein